MVPCPCATVVNVAVVPSHIACAAGGVVIAVGVLIEIVAMFEVAVPHDPVATNR